LTNPYPKVYNFKTTIHRTEIFIEWLTSLRDQLAKAHIARRIDRLARANAGDVKPVGEGVSEMRIDHGPGYRVYFVNRGGALIILLCGGDKRTQERDIKRTVEMVREFK
jgi:putative addiction module killer protein